MTQEEKKYKEALKRAIKAKQNTESAVTIGILEEIFPELREFEDERIRTKLLNLLKELLELGGVAQDTWLMNDCKQFIAWLEKQGEQKHSIDINKMVDDYANNKEHGNEEFGKPVPCMIRAYRQGLNDAIGKVVLAPAWGEEDKVKINRIVACLENLNVADNDILLKDVEWLKSLKQRMGE